MTLKIAVFAPMPIASERMAAAANPGAVRRIRTAPRTSCASVVITSSVRPALIASCATSRVDGEPGCPDEADAAADQKRVVRTDAIPEVGRDEWRGTERERTEAPVQPDGTRANLRRKSGRDQCLA